MKKKLKILCILSKYNFRESKKGNSAEYNAIYISIKKIYNNTKLINTAEKRFKTIKFLNNYIINYVKKNKIDILITSINTYEIYIDTLVELKKISNCKIINWFSDDSWRYEQHTKYYLKYIDVALTNHLYSHKLNLKRNVNSILISWGCPNSWSQNIQKSKNCIYDIIFIGSNYLNRKKYIQYLKKKHINVKCFGSGWQDNNVSENNLKKIIQKSRISLNFSSSRGNEKQTKARIFEITGAGGFCLTETSPDLRKLFSVNEVADFDNKYDLYNKIIYYLKEYKRRDKIAYFGNLKTKKKYLNSIIIKRVLKKISKIDSGPIKNLSINENNQNFISLLKFLNCFVFLALNFFIKNKIKTIKIIRRFYFELEWRTRGELTYSKNGICSKIFNFK